jgi:hypothetical protein
MEDLPPGLETFVRAHIDSVGELEALLLLFRSGDIRWRSAVVAQRLYVREPEAQAILRRLVDLGLAAAIDGEFVFRAQDESLLDRVRELEKFYGTHLIPLSGIIHAKAPSRIREFADAFNFKRKK